MSSGLPPKADLLISWLMPLTLRPTGLSRDPNAKDWCVYDGGTQPVGRIYIVSAAWRPAERAW
jgi:hypothetical protein